MITQPLPRYAGCHVIDMPSLARMKKPAGRAIRKVGLAGFEPTTP